MAYDAGRGRVVLHAGYSAGWGRLDDTWEWDGNTWSQVALLGTRPPARSLGSMAYHAATRRVVLFGGRDPDGRALGDTWLFDGQT